MIDLVDLHMSWQLAQTALVVAMLGVMWRLHRRLDALRDAREEAAQWLERFSGLVARTEILLKQARQHAPVQPAQPSEVKRDAHEAQVERSPVTPAPGRGVPPSAERGTGADGAPGARIARLEDLLGRLR